MRITYVLLNRSKRLMFRGRRTKTAYMNNTTINITLALTALLACSAFAWHQEVTPNGFGGYIIRNVPDMGDGPSTFGH